MKYLLKILLFSAPLLFLFSCGLISSEEEVVYDWYGEWKRTDTDSDGYLILTADTMFTFTESFTSDEWEDCDEYVTDFEIIRKSDVAFTFLLNNDPLYVGIESLSADLNNITLRFEGENETETYARTEIPETCTYQTSDTQ